MMKERSRQARHPDLKKFYQAGISDPQKPLRSAKFVALDFETTGMEPHKDDIVSIGLVPFDLNRVYCREASHWLLNPRQPLDGESIVYHGITHSDIRTAPDLDRILGEVLSAMAGRIAVVHYRRIEREFLDQAMKVRLGEGIQFPVVDTMEIEAMVQRRSSGGVWNKLRGRRPLSVRLFDTRLRYGLPQYQSHHALTDAIATAELLQAQVAHHFSRETRLKDLLI